MARPKRESRETQRAAQRERRPFIGRRDVLTVPGHLKEKGYTYRIVNEDDYRIHAFREAGWEVVENTQVGDPNVGQATQLGSIAGKPVGGGKHAVVMRIKDEWYQEDQAAKEALIKKQLEDITENKYGEGLDKSNLDVKAKINNNFVIEED